MQTISNPEHFEVLTSTYDLVTIGSGSAARAAANEARRLGKSVAMIEHGTAGGTCLNVGCVPSKTLLAAAATRFAALHQNFPGIKTYAEPANLALLVNDKDQMITQFRDTFHVKGPVEAGINVLLGTAVFTPSENRDCVSLVVEGSEDSIQVQAKHCLLYTSDAADEVRRV